MKGERWYKNSVRGVASLKGDLCYGCGDRWWQPIMVKLTAVVMESMREELCRLHLVTRKQHPRFEYIVESFKITANEDPPCSKVRGWKKSSEPCKIGEEVNVGAGRNRSKLEGVEAIVGGYS
ncbi:hypothetical protein LXL04_032004 [Taraxacum kok-saghyz]